MRHTLLLAYLLLGTTLIAGCLGRLPLALRKSAQVTGRDLFDDNMIVPEGRAKRSYYCQVVDEWITYFLPNWAPQERSVRTSRSLPILVAMFKPVLKDALQDVFEKAHVETFNQPLKDLIYGLTTTAELLSNCNHCFDHFMGTVFQEFLIGRAPTPTIQMDEKQFAERLIKFMDQVAQSLKKEIDKTPLPTKLDFDGFWDLFYKAVDDNWDGDNDFGGLLSADNLKRLPEALTKDYVNVAFKTEGQEIYQKNLKCPLPF